MGWASRAALRQSSRHCAKQRGEHCDSPFAEDRGVGLGRGIAVGGGAAGIVLVARGQRSPAVTRATRAAHPRAAKPRRCASSPSVPATATGTSTASGTSPSPITSRCPQARRCPCCHPRSPEPGSGRATRRSSCRPRDSRRARALPSRRAASASPPSPERQPRRLGARQPSSPPPGYSTLRLQEILAQLGYLPLSWTPGAGAAVPTGSAAAQLAAAYAPPPGTFRLGAARVPVVAVLVLDPGQREHAGRGARSPGSRPTTGWRPTEWPAGPSGRRC